MKKLLFSLPILLAFAVAAVPVFGAAEDDLEVRMTPATLVSVVLSPTLIDFGTVPLGSESASSGVISATNNGALAIDLDMRGTNATYGPYTWGLTDVSSDTNQYMMKVSKDDWSSEDALSDSYESFHSNLAVGNAQDFKAKVKMPTSSSGFGEYSANIYVLATEHTP